jgi:anti-sigma regulatory factor (Ser/Thr protein kinase)
VAALLVSELTTNAVRHATTTQFRVCLHLTSRDIQVAVHDDDPSTTPGIRQAGDRDEDGRGLAMVEALSHDWGIGVTDADKCVWFHLRTPAA